MALDNTFEITEQAASNALIAFTDLSVKGIDDRKSPQARMASALMRNPVFHDMMRQAYLDQGITEGGALDTLMSLAERNAPIIDDEDLAYDARTESVLALLNDRETTLADLEYFTNDPDAGIVLANPSETAFSETSYERDIPAPLAEILERVPSGDVEAITDAMSMRYDLVREAIPNEPALEAISIAFGDALLAKKNGLITLDDGLAAEMEIQIEDSTFVDPAADVALDYTIADPTKESGAVYIAEMNRDGVIDTFQPTILEQLPELGDAPVGDEAPTVPDAEAAPSLAGYGSPQAHEEDLSANEDSLPTQPEISSKFNINAADIADANVLLNGVGADDMDFLKDLTEEARELGVDEALIARIEDDIATKDFVTTAAATKGVQVYADALSAALENDGVLDSNEYKGALSGLFTEIAGGAVVDRKGIADDIAAPAGTEQTAKRAMQNVFTNG